MGEIDTKSIESVQTALSFFGEKYERRYRLNGNDEDLEKEKELEGLQKDLANYKVQIEVKDSAYMQAVLKLEHYQKLANEFSTLLKNSEVERDKYIDECRESRIWIDELESKMKEMADQLLETAKIREQLSHVLSDLKATQGELLSMETELAAAKELKFEAMAQAEMMETAANMEKERTEELLKHVAELNEAILLSKLAANESEKEKCAILSEKEAEIQLATATALQVQEQLEDMEKQMEMMQDLENQLLDKSIFIDSLQSELRQAHELQSESAQAASDAVNELNQLKADLELKVRNNLDQVVRIESLEMELDHLTLELKNANKEVGRLNCGIEKLTVELGEVKNEMNEIREKEIEAQVEIALLKSELHKGRSKIAAAEAAEARAISVKSGLYLAVQQLAVEAEEAKKENRRLKEGADKTEEEIENSVLFSSHFENSSQDVELSQIEDSKTKAEERRDDIDAHITISMKEYESLIRKAEKADQVPISPIGDSSQLTTSESKSELEILKRELELAMVKIGEFRTRTEQALSRAELAERAKAAVEDQLRKWREQQQKRRAAWEALREETVPREINPPTFVKTPAPYQPLSKVLNMKF
ncbi:hypothetical protein L1049_028231 [Liquidambar formosana]|uniref:Uncharacterized protein n=1 Tax=Liquidambar formosana TaxID=63359 RepID=A0AAP0RJY3_LIQFO